MRQSSRTSGPLAKTIKRKLKLQLRGARIFLDVDDLDEIDKLEEYVNAAQCFLVFLSKGYFFSKNCLRELDSASACGVMPVLVHEISVDHGGTSLETLRADCVSQKRDADSLFDGNKIVPWHRLADFQHLSLQKIAEEMLFSQLPPKKAPSALLSRAAVGEPPLKRGVSADSHCQKASSKASSPPPPLKVSSSILASPRQRSSIVPASEEPDPVSVSRPRLFLPGALASQALEFRRPVRLYVSDANPGAATVAEELLARYKSKNLVL